MRLRNLEGWFFNRTIPNFKIKIILKKPNQKKKNKVFGEMLCLSACQLTRLVGWNWRFAVYFLQGRLFHIIPHCYSCCVFIPECWHPLAFSKMCLWAKLGRREASPGQRFVWHHRQRETKPKQRCCPCQAELGFGVCADPLTATGKPWPVWVLSPHGSETNNAGPEA